MGGLATPEALVLRWNELCRDPSLQDLPCKIELNAWGLEGEALGALWNVANEIEPWTPQPKSVPTLWAWKRIEPHYD